MIAGKYFQLFLKNIDECNFYGTNIFVLRVLPHLTIDIYFINQAVRSVSVLLTLGMEANILICLK